ncbi:hypothetical protein BKA83DRAFT_689075 [Pisolithus microcarpus]|nr:hypothetical protein BKA83DRAFT_689075 [Pisolithus microcarpus]
MFHHHRPRLLQLRQDSTLLPVSGSVVVSDPTPTASALAQNTAAVASGTQAGIPLVTSSDNSQSTSTTAASDSSTTTDSSSSSSSGSQIPLSTVIGACVAAFTVLIFAVLLAIYCSKRQKSNQKQSASSRHRNAANDVSRRRSHLEPWGRLPDYNEDHWEGKSSMRQRPSSSPIDKLAAMFNRTPSTNSGEKSSEGPHARESFGTLQAFEKYHPDLAAEMASQAAVAEADAEIMKPPPARTYMNHGESISWDGDTVRGDSFLSRGSRLSGNMSPTVMSKEKMTPPAVESRLHRWESAEVLHTDHPGPAHGRQNPFADAAAVSLKRGASNPFFNAQEKPTKRTLLPNMSVNPFADSHSVTSLPTNSATNPAPAGNVRALQSLIAALETSPAEVEERLRVISMQSSVYSHGSYSACETGEDAVSITAFPYPPAQIPHS